MPKLKVVVRRDSWIFGRPGTLLDKHNCSCIVGFVLLAGGVEPDLIRYQHGPYSVFYEVAERRLRSTNAITEYEYPSQQQVYAETPEDLLFLLRGADPDNYYYLSDRIMQINDSVGLSMEECERRLTEALAPYLESLEFV